MEQIVIQKAEQVIEILDEVIRRLVLHQANHVLSKISPIEIMLTNPIIDISFDNINLLDARSSISEFSLGFDTLEREYLRLQSEVEAVREVRNLA